ncbi:MAG: hypothetical protein IJT97_02635, partial [Bacteroidaceae bacterium]|nr:hypothetical protein [Bacteroidaceae bacterium]
MAGIRDDKNQRAVRYAISFRLLIAYLTAGCSPLYSFPAISPYLRHGCMAGYPYPMPMASLGGTILSPNALKR